MISEYFIEFYPLAFWSAIRRLNMFLVYRDFVVRFEAFQCPIDDANLEGLFLDF